MTANQTLDRHARAGADVQEEGVVVMARCVGTTKKDKACTASVPVGTKYCYHHDPTRAEERSRKASRAASAKHDSIAKGIRKMREDIHELIYMIATDRINPRAKNRLTDMVQLSQSYA